MTETIRPRRSALYMPASNARAVDKARQLACDVVILDLEDAVAPEAKVAARAAAIAAVDAGGYGTREIVLRINALDTPWGADDLDAARNAGFDAILVPKVDTADDIRRIDDRLRDGAGGARLWAMIETCAAIGHLSAIAALAGETRLTGWVVGTNDLALEMRCDLSEDRSAVLPILTLAIVAARARGLSILDGVHNAIDDDRGFQAVCSEGRKLGFDGKTLIHPRQIEACNAAFLPDAERVARAQSIIAAFAREENRDRGVIRLDGEMIERLHLREAERLVAIQQAITRGSAVGETAPKP